MQRVTQARSDFREALSHNQDELEDHFGSVLEGFETGDMERIRAEWDRLDVELMTHLRAEEELLLPLYELKSSAEAARIRADHHRIRRMLEQLAADLDLHALARDKVEALIDEVRAHAASKEHTLYAWADATLPRHKKTSVLERLHGGSQRKPVHHHAWI